MCRAVGPLLLTILVLAAADAAEANRISFGPWLTIVFGHEPPVVAAPAAPAPTAAAKASPAAAASPAATALGVVVKTPLPAAAAAAAGSPTAAVGKPAVHQLPPTPAAKPAATANSAPSFPVLAPTSHAAKAPAGANASPGGGGSAGIPPLEFKQPGATKTIKIGCTLPLTGQKADVGAAARYGIAMALDALLKQELPGTNAILQCEDSKCLDVPAFNAVNNLAKEPGVIGIVGEICSAASVAAADRATQLQIPVISPSSTASSLSEADAFFRVVPPDQFQAAAIADRMFRQGHRKAGVVYAKTTYGWGLALNFVSAFTALGGKVAADFDITPSPASPGVAAAAVAKLKASGVDVVFIASNQYEPVADFLKAAAAAGLDVPMFGGDGMADTTLLQLLGDSPSAISRLTVSQLPAGPPSFAADFERFVKGAAPFRNAAALAFDATAALLRAYKVAAAPRDGPAVIKQLGRTDFAGLTGRVRFDSNGDRLPVPQQYSFARFDERTKALVPIS